jgi:hypothetical protein
MFLQKAIDEPNSRISIVLQWRRTLVQKIIYRHLQGIRLLCKIVSKVTNNHTLIMYLLNIAFTVQVCDATGATFCSKAGYKKLIPSSLRTFPNCWNGK